MSFFRTIGKLIYYLTKDKSEQKQKEFLVENPEDEKESNLKETTLESELDNPYLTQVRNWAMSRIDSLHDQDRHKNAKALAAEFNEWINIPEGTEELDYLCIEDQGWTEQEIDVREPNT